MSVVKVIELMCSSEKSWEDAVAKGVAQASKSIKGIRSAWVQDQSVTVKSGKVNSYRVTLKVSFAVKS